jgi:hypothetical protein
VPKKIFLSYSSRDKDTADAIALSLRSQGCEVFFDRDDLPAGESYIERIGRAIKDANLFIFLISPDSVGEGEGRFTVSELTFARRKWPNPSGHVLPVVVRKTPFEHIPPYLKAVTILEPVGNIAAETSEAVRERFPVDDYGGLGRFVAQLIAYPHILALGAFRILALGAFRNREILGWIGGGVVAVAVGWAVFIYVFPPKKIDAPGTSGAQAKCGGVAIGGNVTGATITAGTATNSDCSTKPK